MRFRFVVLLLMLSFGSSRAQQVMAFGIGQESCKVWLSSRRNFEEGRSWSSGYWTSANMRNSSDHLVGSKSDANGLADAVKAACREKPSRLLMNAATEAYSRFQD
jgi:hypothetical protein